MITRDFVGKQINVKLACQMERIHYIPDRPDKILSWDIGDPWGGSIEEYRKCAEAIKDRLSDLRRVLEEAEGIGV